MYENDPSKKLVKFSEKRAECSVVVQTWPIVDHRIFQKSLDQLLQINYLMRQNSKYNFPILYESIGVSNMQYF